MNNFLTGALILIINLGNPKLHEYKNPVQLQLEHQIQQEQMVLEETTKKVEKFLSSYNSPLAKNSSDIVNVSDKYNIDPALVVAIAGVESTFETQGNLQDNNPYGIGCFDGRPCPRFRSVKDSTEQLAQTLQTHGAYQEWRETGEVRDLAQNYLTGNKKRWTEGVKKFMGELENE